jgi:intein/homing endonuclease
MKNNLLFYIAGYIDGDGCFYIGKYQQGIITVYEQSIQIVSVKEPVLQIFKNVFGGAIRKKPFKKRHKDAFCWTIKGKYAVKIAIDITNYLVEKTNQCQLFIDFSQTIQFNKGKSVTNNNINQRSHIIKLIREDKHMNNLITKESIENLKNEALTIIPTETDFSYLAGLIDSEGCFRIKKWKPKNRPNHVYAISIEIGNTKLPIMPWLIKRFGGNVHYIPASGTRKNSATWTLSAASLFKILPKIRLFLRSKKEVCDKLIEFQETILPNGGDRHSELFRALFEKRQEVRERIVREVHQLNHRGSI